MKKKTSTLFRRGTAYLLALMLCVSTVQVTAFAADGDTPEGGEQPTVVQPDPVNVTLDNEGNLNVEKYPTPEVNGEGTEYKGNIKDEDGIEIKQPSQDPTSSEAPPTAELNGTITEKEEPVKKDEDPTPPEEDKGENEDQPSEPKEEVISTGNITGKEETDVMDRTDTIPDKEKPEGGDTEHKDAIVKNPGDDGFNNTANATLNQKVDKDGKPVIDENGNPVYEGTGSSNETEITVDEKNKKAEEILEKEYGELKAPDGYTSEENSNVYTKEDKENGITLTWEKKESKDQNNKFSYETIETETKVVTQKDLPAPSLAPTLEEKPATGTENGVTVTDSEDGKSYTVEKTTTDGEGNVVTTETQVVTPGENGAYTVEKTTIDADGKETKETVTVRADGSYSISKTYLGEKGETITDTKTVFNGTMTVKTTTVTTTVTKHTIDYDKNSDTTGDTKGSVSVGVTVTEGDGHGSLKTEGLVPDMTQSVAYKVDASSLKVRSEPTTEKNNQVDSIVKGSIVYVIETRKVGNETWGRIGDERWICLDSGNTNKPSSVKPYAGQPYKVTASSLNVRQEPKKDGKYLGSVKNGDIVYIVEEKDGWLKTSNGGWISKDYAKDVGPGPFDPEDRKTNTYTDLYGWENQGEFTGRPNDKYTHTGTLYQTNSTDTVLYFDKSGKMAVADAIPKTGYILIDESKNITKDGVEYCYIGTSQWNTPLYVKMDSITKQKGELKPGEGQFLFYGEYGLSSAVGVNLVDKEGIDPVTKNPFADYYNVHQFVIKDEYGNDHYVYCSDLSVHPDKGTNYGMTNVEDADYLKENADIIKAIATNGYWGTSSDTGSMESFKQWLKNSGYVTDVNDLNWLTPGLAMSVTQAAIWHFGNSKNAGTERELDETTPFEKDKYGNIVTDSEMESLNALYKFLTNPDNAKDLTKDAAESTKLLNASSVQNVSVTVTKADSGTSTVTTDNSEVKDTYDASISFKLDIDPATLMNNTSIVVTLIGTDGKELKDEKGNTITHKYALAGTSGVAKGMEGIKNFFSNGTGEKEKTYTLTVPGLPGGVTLNLTLEGAQKIQKGAYLISAQGGFDKSQTFISVESGSRDFNLNMKLNLSVESAQATVTTTTTPEVTKTERINREWSWDTKTTQKVVEPDPEKPDNPTPTPENPTTPPPTPRTPDPDPSDDPEIPDEPVPLTYIPEEPVPQAPLPPEDLIDIFDGDVPLASPYGTGDNSTVWYLIAVISVAGLFGLRLLERKANGENAK